MLDLAIQVKPGNGCHRISWLQYAGHFVAKIEGVGVHAIRH